jgi:HlyD family secretion protein
MKKLILIVIVVLAVGAAVGAYYMRKGGPEPTVSTLPITRGDVAEVIQATGTLQAVETVDVGTQVSGVVQELYADFNSIVRRGEIIARLDPSLIETQIEQQRANVIRSEADLDRLKVSLADAQQKLERARELEKRNLIPRTELEAAELNVKTQESQIKSSEAGLNQARSQLNTQQVNLGHTVIRAPIDGIVISRNVDQGQTVAASMSAPTLFILAADLTKMQVLANIDESEVGRMRPGQPVTFRVDAYMAQVFTGTVEQVRLQPSTVQNVVTYQTVIAVPNPEYKLMPGMTATVSVEIARRNNVLRVPNAALRFRPTADTFQALNLPVPEDLQRGNLAMLPGMGGNAGGGGRRGGAGTGAPQSAAAANQPQGPGQPQPGSPEARGGGDQPAAGQGGGRGGRGGFDPNMSPEERQRRMEERMAGMSPEERAQFEARMAQGQTQGRQGGAAQQAARPTQQASGIQSTKATTIDALFAPLPPTETRGRVWVWGNGELKAINVRLGISDGTHTELIEGSGLQQGTEIVSNVTTGLEPAARPGQAGQGAGQNPLMPQQRGGGPGGGRGR